MRALCAAILVFNEGEGDCALDDAGVFNFDFGHINEQPRCLAHQSCAIKINGLVQIHQLIELLE